MTRICTLKIVSVCVSMSKLRECAAQLRRCNFGRDEAVNIKSRRWICKLNFQFLEASHSKQKMVGIVRSSMIISMEIIDFVTGTIAAIINPVMQTKLASMGYFIKILEMLADDSHSDVRFVTEKDRFAFLYSIYLGYIPTFSITHWELP